MKTVFASDIKISVDELVEAHLNGTSVVINDIKYRVVSGSKNFDMHNPFIGSEFELRAFGSFGTHGCNGYITKEISISIHDVKRGITQIKVIDRTDSETLVSTKTGEAIEAGHHEKQ